MEKTIVIGKVLKPQGIKGEVKVLPLTSDPQRFCAVKDVQCGQQTLTVDRCQVRGEYVYLSFCGMEDRNAVESLRNKELSVPREQAVTLPKDAWFIVDLVGCQVVDEAGTFFGEVTDVLQNGGADVYVLDGGKCLFPALKKLLSIVDVDHKRIVVNRKVFDEVVVHED